MSQYTYDIKDIASGNEISFEYFMSSYSNRLFHYAMGIVKSKETAEEVVSDVFLEVWKNRSSLLEIENLNSWLYTVTYRKCISSIRKDADVQSVSLDDVDDFLFTPIQSPDEAIISKEEMNKINQAIQSLPPKCKHVFYLAKIEKLPYKEISDILNISIKTINNHIATALEKISSFLKEE